MSVNIPNPTYHKCESQTKMLLSFISLIMPVNYLFVSTFFSEDCRMPEHVTKESQECYGGTKCLKLYLV